jgi:hypothetical protein
MRDVEYIYNAYNRIQRKRKGLPYKNRKDFSDIQNNENYATLLKLEQFFKRNHYININDFFESPHDLYADENYFKLDFYLSQKAMKAYSIYQRKKVFSDPDSDIQRKFVLEGWKYIYDFCVQENINLDQYIDHKTNLLNTVFIHLKEKNVSIYNCLVFDNFQRVVNSQNYEMLEFMLGDLVSKIPIFRTRFYSSKKCKKIAQGGYEILKEKLEIRKN